MKTLTCKKLFRLLGITGQSNVIIAIIFMTAIFMAGSLYAGQLSIDDKGAAVNSQVVFTLLVTSTSNDCSTLGLDITYDSVVCRATPGC